MCEISAIGQTMLRYQEELAAKYRYRKQPRVIADENYQKYYDNLPKDFSGPVRNLSEGMEIVGRAIPLISKGGTLFARKYDRIVIGQYGAFIEIDPADMIMAVVKVKKGQEYRIDDPKYAEHVKYQWFTTDDNSDCKLYYQQKGVVYADYKPDKWYVSPYEVCDYAEIAFYGYDVKEPVPHEADQPAGEIRVPVKGGMLIAEQNHDPYYPGINIYFQTNDGDVMDIVGVEAGPEHDDNIKTYCYEDAYSDDVTRTYTLLLKHIMKAFSD